MKEIWKEVEKDCCDRDIKRSEQVVAAWPYWCSTNCHHLHHQHALNRNLYFKDEKRERKRERVFAFSMIIMIFFL